GSDSGLGAALPKEQVHLIEMEQIPDLTKHPPLNGRYRLVRFHKRGGQAWVFEALDATCQQKLAVKVVFKSQVSATAILHLIEEVQKTGRLPADQFVHVYDWGEEKEFAWYAMEWLEGQTLREVIDARPKAIPWDEAFGMTAEIL